MVTITEVKNGTVSLSDIMRITSYLEMRADYEYNEQEKVNPNPANKTRRW